MEGKQEQGYDFGQLVNEDTPPRELYKDMQHKSSEGEDSQEILQFHSNRDKENVSVSL